jgi:hypothetical protein
VQKKENKMFKIEKSKNVIAFNRDREISKLSANRRSSFTQISTQIYDFGYYTTPSAFIFEVFVRAFFEEEFEKLADVELFNNFQCTWKFSADRKFYISGKVVDVIELDNGLLLPLFQISKIYLIGSNPVRTIVHPSEMVDVKRFT